MFSENTSLAYSNNRIKWLENNFNVDIARWLPCNKLAINLYKTVGMHANYIKQKLMLLSIVINSVTLKEVDTYK